MRNPPEQAELDADTIEMEHRRARERLAAANERFSRALAVAERLKYEQLNPLEAVEDAGVKDSTLIAARDAAEANYRVCLAAMKKDSSDTARWRCARALIEFDRLSEKVTTRRIR